ncbi:hypothetical protein C8039_15350 [Halogeometricum sp. wsp3]|nr:hypothetical protein C8039_15350 [Halogeometricum sp. wsp3]
MVMISEHPAATVLYLSLREDISVRRTNAQADGVSRSAAWVQSGSALFRLTARYFGTVDVIRIESARPTRSPSRIRSTPGQRPTRRRHRVRIQCSLRQQCDPHRTPVPVVRHRSRPSTATKKPSAVSRR